MLRGSETEVEGVSVVGSGGVSVLDGEHAVLGVKTEAGDGSVVWRRVMDGSKWIEDAWVVDHVVGGNVVVPGAWTLEALSAAAGPGKAVCDVEFVSLLSGVGSEISVVRGTAGELVGWARGM